MKCPKCKFITFDYLDTCPKCGKDMAPEKDMFNISALKAETPSLLGSLMGDVDDSGTGNKVPESIEEGAGDMNLKDKEVYDDGSELDINLEENTSESGAGTELELGDLDLSISEEDGGQEGIQTEKTEEDSEDIELKLDFEEDEDSK